MTTAYDIVRAALRKIGVTGAEVVPTADELAEGLAALNRMLHGWKLRGVDIEHTDLAADTTFPLGPEYELGTIYLLARDISHDFMVPPSFDPERWFRNMQAAYLVPAEAVIPKGLQIMPSQYGRGKRSRWYT
jgi:hypothetical protein